MPATCAACIHYSAPGMATAYCRHPAGPPDWLDVPERGDPRWANWTPAVSYVRADNGCARWEAAEQFELAEAAE